MGILKTLAKSAGKAAQSYGGNKGESSDSSVGKLSGGLIADIKQGIAKRKSKSKSSSATGDKASLKPDV